METNLSWFKAYAVKKRRAFTREKSGRVYSILENLVLPRTAGSSMGQVNFQGFASKDDERFWSIGVAIIYDCRLLIAD